MLKILFQIILTIIAAFLMLITIPIGFIVRSLHLGFLSGCYFRDKL